MVNKTFFFLLFSSVIIIGCKPYHVIDGDKCNSLSGDSLLIIKTLLEKNNIDTSFRLGFSMDYSRKGFYLICKSNKWEINFSEKYFDIEIKYADNNFVLVYCKVSGIINGLTLFPIDHNDLFILDKKLGKKVLDIQSKAGGITNAVIREGTIYFEYYEPDIVRYTKLN